MTNLSSLHHFFPKNLIFASTISHYYEERFQDYTNKRERVLSGGINCIPSPFERFKSEFPGIEKAKYYGVTGNQKSGKSQLTDFLFLLHPIKYAYNNRDKLRIKVFYFSLEMSISEKYDQFTCYWLYNYTKGRIRISTRDLNSLNVSKPLSEEVLALLQTDDYKEFFNFVEENVFFEESIRNPYK